MRRVHLVIVAVLCAGCGASSKSTVVVPPVDTTSLQYALQRLDKAGLRVQLTDFGPLPPGYVLEGASVGDQEPEPGHPVRRGTVVKLNMHGPSPIPSPVVRIHHAPYVEAPGIVGLTWRQAERRLREGYWLAIGHVPALGPHDPDEVLDAYVVTGESPPAGTRLPFGGTKTASGGFNPTTIAIRIGVRD